MDFLTNTFYGNSEDGTCMVNLYTHSLFVLQWNDFIMKNEKYIIMFEDIMWLHQIYTRSYNNIDISFLWLAVKCSGRCISPGGKWGATVWPGL